MKKGGTIYLKPGTYHESGIKINKNLKIIGENTANTIINSQNKQAITITGQVTLQSFTIKNANVKGKGGAIYNKGILKLEKIKIQNSNATTGGAIYNEGRLTATKSIFANNNATRGSSIYSTNYTNIKECNFTRNYNTPVYIKQSNETYIKSSKFINNNATMGGAIYNRYSTMYITNATFTTNNATVSGGAIYNLGTTNIKKSIFNSNIARNGGTIINKDTTILTDTIIKNSNATTGGAIYNTAKLSIKNNTFHNNKAQNGGAIYTKTGNPTKINITYSQFTYNSAKTGGALYVYNHSIINVKYSIFKSNNNSAIYIKTTGSGNNIYNSSFTKNNATIGGAIRNAYANISVKKNIFSQNNAKYGSTLHNLKGNVILNYNILTDNNKDIYNTGKINANYNWWGNNNINKNRTVNTKPNNWLYLTINHKYARLMNSTINTSISLYNVYDKNKIRNITSKSIPDIPMKIVVNGCGVSENYSSNSGYYNLTNKFNKEGKVKFMVKAPYETITDTLNIITTSTANIFVNSLQSIKTKSIALPVNVTDELNNSVNTGIINLYLNNKKIVTKPVSHSNLINIPSQKVGVYNLKVEFKEPNYKTVSKTVKLTVNPKTNYSMRIVKNPSLFTQQRGTLRAIIRNENNKKTVNKGKVKFYFDDKYVGSSEVKNNLSTLKIIMPSKKGNHSVKTEYYRDNKFVLVCAEILPVNKQEAHTKQYTYITLSGDLINNSKITSNKKDVYFAMDRTTASYDYSPNDMKIMNTIAYNLRSNGFNVKTVKNGPGETYETARYMYNHKVRNSICFVLCNGVDANVIREYLRGYDNLLTAVRNRGNDIVLGWFYGAGDIYNPDGEYYYWLEKAWDDNYSKWGGISNPRKTMEKDGIKIVYEKYDMKGDSVAQSFVKLYGGKITEKVPKNSTLSLKTKIYNTKNAKINGSIVYTLNDKIIRKINVTKNEHTFRYTVPNISGTYNLKVTYYSNNKPVCSTSRYLKIQ